MSLPRMISLQQAATETGLSYSYLRRLCLDGEVYAVRPGVKWMLNANSLSAFLGGEGKEVAHDREKELSAL